MLEKDFAFFKAHINEYLKDHNGEYVVIKDEKALGFYPTEKEAFASMKESKLGSFIVQKIIPLDKSVVEFYTRRVAFA